MYVCVCHSVTDRQIRQAAAEGAHTMDRLSAELKVASRCGRCAECARKILAELGLACPHAEDDGPLVAAPSPS